MNKQIKKLPYLQELYQTDVAPSLNKDYNVKNVHLTPKIDKVIVHMRLGRDSSDKKAIEAAINELSLICGRKPVVSKAKQSIATLKVREGQVSGAYCTLRREACYYFLERLIYMSLPRIKDFKGFKMSSFDRTNNLAIGIKDHLIFHELSYDKIYKTRGLDILIVFKNSTSHQMSYDLLKRLNFPIKKN